MWNRPSLEPRLLLALPLLAEAFLGPAGGDAGVRRIAGAAGIAALALCRYEPLLGVALGAWAAGCAAFAWRGGGRRRAVRWLTAVALVVFGLAVLEVAARLKDGAPVGPDPLGEFLQPGADETPVWTGKGPDEEPIANPIVFNAPPLGPPMHDVEHALEKPAGVRRVLVLGDSFVEGVQVPTDALFHRRLEAALDRDGRRVECVAGAHSGWGQAETLEHLREVGLAYAPDLVLVEFLPNNDVSDNLPRLRHAVQVDDVRASWAVPLQLDAGHKGLAGVKLLAGVLDTAWRRVVGSGDSLRDQVYREHPTRRPDDWAEAWARTEALLGELDQAARAGGARLGVVIFPAPKELLSPQPYPAARVRAVCEAQEIPVLDLTPTFAASEWLPAYLPEDHHWAALGHARAAEATAAWVEAQGLLP
ncbi:MAG: hypothetical protein R3F62_18275 [Planctomycetota bacterium]